VSVEQADAIAFTLDLEARAAEVCAPLALRAGIASGYALLFEGDDYIGSAVNLASRLCDLANDYEVLIPAMGLERLPEGVTATPHGAVELAGFPGEIEIFELSGTRPPPTARHRQLWTGARSFSLPPSERFVASAGLLGLPRNTRWSAGEGGGEAAAPLDRGAVGLHADGGSVVDGSTPGTRQHPLVLGADRGRKR
jgi:hypothetical protein